MFIYSLNPRSKNKLECLCLQGKIQTKKKKMTDLFVKLSIDENKEIE